LFRSAHAFSLSELASMEALTDADLRAAVAGASYGSGFLRLDNAAKALKTGRDRLFLKSGSKPEINQLFGALRETDRKLLAHENEAARYFRLRAEQEETDAELSRLSARLADIRRDFQVKRIYLSLWADYVEHQDAQQSLDALPAPPASFPDDARALYTALLEKMEALDREAADLRAEQQSLVDQKKKLQPDPKLLEQEMRIREAAALGPELAALEREVAAAGRLAGEKRQALSRVLQSLGPGFNEARLAEAAERAAKGAGFSRRIAEAGAFVQRLAGIEAAARAGREVRERAVAAVSALQRDLEAVPVPEPGPDEILRQKKALGSTPALFSALVLAQRELTAARQALAATDALRPPSPLLLPALATGLVLCLGAAGIFLYLGLARGFTALGAAVPVAGLLLALQLGMGFAWLRRKKAGMLRLGAEQNEVAGRAEQAASDAREKLARLLAACGLSPDDLDEARIEERRTELDQCLTSLNAREQAKERLARAREELAREQERQAGRVKEQADFQAGFSAWLSDAGLPADLSPAAAGDALGRVEKAAGLASEIQATEQARETARTRAGAILHEVRTLFAALDRPAPDAENAARELARLAEDLEAACRARAQLAGLSLNLEPLARKIADRDARKAELEKKRAALFHSAGVADEALFLALCRQQEERARLLSRRDTAALGLRKISGRSELASLLKELSPFTREGLAEEAQALESSLAGMEERKEEQLRRSADLGGEADRLAADETAGRLRSERETLLAGISSRSREWAALALAEKLLGAAVARFEKDHQPRVVKRAGELFSEITRGRYTGLVLVPDKDGRPVPCAITPSGVRKPPEALSRGTAEQLYLCLRLAYASSGDETRARLPVIMDDVLVNFDAERARQAARIIAQAARANQVLFFTCHQRTVDDLLSTGASLARFSLAQGTISRIAP
ncbi:MAG: hypothetical protein AB1921_00480, partial [Thermodesulfobacteriota bacterium]